jgi:plastocyanin
MRRLLVGAGLAVSGLLAVPAWADTTDVTVSGFAFSPATVQIQPGDTVTWHFSGPDENHSVTSDAGQSESFDSDPNTGSPFHTPADTFSHQFNAAGRFTYHCKVHSFMTGTVQVGDTGPPPPTGDTTPPGVSQLKAKGGKKCKPHARHCKGKPTRVTFLLSEDAKVHIDFTRKGGGKSPKPLERDMTAGSETVKLSTKRVPRGRYSLSLVATDAAGNASNPATASFRVR